MPDAISLLVCRDPALIESVKEVHDSIDALQLSVCDDIEEACARVRRSPVVLNLVCLEGGGDEADATRLLWTVAETRRCCSTLLLVDKYKEHQAQALLRAGAADYLEFPLDLGKLGHLVNALTRRLRFPACWEAAEPLRRATAAAEELFEGIPPEIAPLMDQVRRVAPQDTTVLLTGETGAGKTRLARLIHELSPRRAEPFLVVDCGALSATLIESELFGHARGAFTGADRDRPGKLAAAGRGTLLLDEVNSLPLPLQAKLLRAADDRVFEPVGSNKPLPVRARLIAASSTPLDREVQAGRFRADLYYRINVVGFHLPPLRERRSAVGPLARRFLREAAGRNRPDVTGITAASLLALEGYDWPGNIRELRNVVERAAALCAGPVVQEADLPAAVLAAEAARPAAAALAAIGTLAASKQEAEARRIQEALRRHNNNRLRAAAELGISRMALYKKLHKYGLMRIA
jgi:DNA-binding NtrC family response regulator